ncbi:hypothetical protein BJY24_006916 [Nocardia transvalensis]|uniref:Peptidase n=1 Tax=Nocardia transvalensis TaxID=37333 RepID=A0A7W9ULX1_9NOCA|nr:hypothetical protein [Nocardia transvalensis]MBB5918004.1 hypothetical protein [Nocardia transvalensis]
MTAWRRSRDWFAARRRFEFVATVAMVVALTAAGGALILLPKAALSKVRPAPAVAEAAAPLDPDPQLADLRRVMESYGPVVTQQVSGEEGRLSTVLGHPRQRADVDTLAREIGPAVTAITELWGPEWSRSAVVAVASSPSEFAAISHATGPVSAQVAAASVADPFLPGHQPTGQRVVFAPNASRRLGAEGLRDTLRHELTHVAARARTVDGSPQWVLEGFAEYSARRDEQDPFATQAPLLSARARTGALPDDLPGDAAFAPAAGTDATLAYEQAWAANAFAASQFGEARLVRLYQQLATGPKDADALDRSLRDCLGVGHTDFVARWRDWIKSRIAT